MKFLDTRKYYLSIITILLVFLTSFIIAQDDQSKTIKVTGYQGNIEFDGLLNEPFWQNADSIDSLKMVEPKENAPASYRTVVKIVADSENIIIGIICYDDPKNITAYTKARDVDLENEDNIKFVFDTYRDERNGYIFSVNPFGARYDAIVADRGEDENSNWDGVWDARTSINADGWSAEFIIPAKTLSFKSGLHEWGFNIERRIQRFS